MYTYDQACRVCRVAFNGGVVDQIMIHSYNCSDLLLSIVTESVSLDHRLVLSGSPGSVSASVNSTQPIISLELAKFFFFSGNKL